MASSSDTPTRFRIVDLETTGTTPNDAVVEIGAVDLVGREIIPIGSDLVRPPVPIPPEASAIHQITDTDVSRRPRLEEVLPRYMGVDGADRVDVFVAHHWASIFGAICPAKGKGAGLVMPWCDSQAMSAHLKEISQAVDPGAHAVLLLDQAGWHPSPKVKGPATITLRPLPPRSPELNAVENVWPFLRDNWLSDRVFNSYEDIVDHCCAAWNKLVDQPWTIMSIGLRRWAQEC